MPLVAGVDSSTQSTKIEVRDLESGAVVARGSAPHPATTPPRSEQDPEAWWQAFERAWAQAGSPVVAAISVAGQQHGLVPLDAARTVIRPAKLWNDTESAPDAAALIGRGVGAGAGELGGGSAWADACGSLPVAAFTITKLAWLRRVEPESFARLAHVALPHDWLTFRLTGTLGTDRGDASGTGYWSPAESRYRLDLLELVEPGKDWSAVPPPVLGPLEPAGEWRGAVVGPGTGDNMAAALGLGLAPGEVVVSLGTSGTVYTVSPAPVADPSGAVAGFADATGRFLPLVCTLNATKVTETIRRLLGVSHEELDRLALASAPGAGGLTLLPYLDGERTPNRPDATGVLAGLRTDSTAEQVARAAFEGVVCGLLDGLDALRAHAPGGVRLVLVGGGARSVAYRQVLADLSPLPVTVVDASVDAVEAVAAGACVQAAAVLEQCEPALIAARWGLDRRTPVETSAPADSALLVRQAYAARRDREPEQASPRAQATKGEHGGRR